MNIQNIRIFEYFTSNILNEYSIYFIIKTEYYSNIRINIVNIHPKYVSELLIIILEINYSILSYNQMLHNFILLD